jgi:sugar/nucleoside kinase (ribokinase family)
VSDDTGEEDLVSIVVVGSLALDTVETPSGKVEEALGGSGSFFALAARLFVPVKLLAVIGDDFPGEHLTLLERHDVDLGHVERVAGGKSFRWGGTYGGESGHDLNTRKTLFTHLNVFETWRPSLPAELVDTSYLFLANLDPELQAAVMGQVEGAKLVVCDTMDLWIGGKRDALISTLQGVDICIINDSEAEELAEKKNLYVAGRTILDMGPRVVVIKKGEHGAVLMTRDMVFAAPAYPLERCVDPTGAGDTFAGGFLGHLAASGDISDRSLRQAVIYGTAAASHTVEHFSVDGLAGITRADLDARARELQRLSQFELDA